MDAALAQECLRRLLCTVLRQSGFDASSPDALVELEDKVMMLIGGLLHMAHQYAELARRTKPLAVDMLEACEAGGVSLRSLVDTLRITSMSQRHDVDIIRFTSDCVQPDPSSTFEAFQDPTKPFLPDNAGDVTRRASYAPDFLPYLPPSHSYKQTPVYPSIATAEQALAAGIPFVDPKTGEKTLVPQPEAEAEAQQIKTTADKRMSQLDARIKITRLVEASLQNLIRATSKASNTGQAGGDSLGEEDGSMAVVPGERNAVAQKDAAIINLLRKYEKDAALCNFEVEWYGSTGTNATNQPTTANDTDQAAAAGLAAAQRKRGRWKY